jgi:hypothetical protein
MVYASLQASDSSGFQPSDFNRLFDFFLLFINEDRADIAEHIRTAKEVSVYHKQPLPGHFLEPLRDRVATGLHFMVEIVVEDLSDVVSLRELHSSGFKLFYGVGLPHRSVVFTDPRQGFLQENNSPVPGFSSLSSTDAECLYYKLRRCRFGHPVLLTSVVNQMNADRGLFCLATEVGREFSCRFK